MEQNEKTAPSPLLKNTLGDKISGLALLVEKSRGKGTLGDPVLLQIHKTKGRPRAREVQRIDLLYQNSCAALKKQKTPHLDEKT